MSTATFNFVNRNSTPFYPEGLAKYLPTKTQPNWAKLQSAKNQPLRKESDCDSCASLTTMDSCDSRNSPATQSPVVNFSTFSSTRTSIMAPQEQEEVILNSAIKQVKKTVDDTKYKTELCKKFEMTGHCPYFAKCRFAHGKEELNEKGGKKKYQNKNCKNFHSVMNCPYGSRCMFAHETRTVQELRSDFGINFKVNYLEMKEAGFVGKTRMGAFARIAEDETVAKRSELVKSVFNKVEDECEEILNLCRI